MGAGTAWSVPLSILITLASWNETITNVHDVVTQILKISPRADIPSASVAEPGTT